MTPLSEGFDFRLAKALRLLLLEKPFYYFMLSKLNKEHNPDFPAPAAVVIDKTTFQIRLILNPKLLFECTAEDLKIVLEHEMLHLCFQHLINIRGIYDPLYNEACDYIINDNIDSLVGRYKELLGPSPSNKLFSKLCLAPLIRHIPEIQGRKVCDMDSYTLYEILKKNKDATPKNRDLMDQHGSNEKTEEEDRKTSTQIPQSAVDRLMSESFQDAKGHEGRHSLPGEVERRLKEFAKTDTDYRRVFQLFLSKLKAPDHERTWTRRSRKYPDQVKGKRSLFRPLVVVVIDTSGSMSSERVQKAIAGEIMAAAAFAGELFVVAGDVRENSRIKTSSGRIKISDLAFRGGGDTDLQFGWNAASELKADGVIVYTDGLIPSFDSFGIKTLFCIYPGGREIHGYKNLRMKA